jgi:hypothetical protein
VEGVDTGADDGSPEVTHGHSQFVRESRLSRAVDAVDTHSYDPSGWDRVDRWG